MAKRIFLYAPGCLGPDRPGVLLDLGSPEHAAFVRGHVAALAKWFTGPEWSAVGAVMAQAPEEVREGAFRPELRCFWAAPVECPWAIKGEPIDPGGREFDPGSIQAMDDTTAERLFGIRQGLGCAPCGSDSAGAVFEHGAVGIAVRRAPEGFEDDWVECLIPAEKFIEVLAPVLDGVQTEEEGAVPAP